MEEDFPEDEAEETSTDASELDEMNKDYKVGTEEKEFLDGFSEVKEPESSNPIDIEEEFSQVNEMGMDDGIDFALSF